MVLTGRWSRGWTAVSPKYYRPFIIRFFMGNCKPQNVTWPRSCGHVRSFQFTFEPREGLPAVSNLRQGLIFATKNCTASRLKVWTSFLYPFAISLLDFWSPIHELLLIFGPRKSYLASEGVSLLFTRKRKILILRSFVISRSSLTLQFFR